MGPHLERSGAKRLRRVPWSYGVLEAGGGCDKEQNGGGQKEEGNGGSVGSNGEDVEGDVGAVENWTGLDGIEILGGEKRPPYQIIRARSMTARHSAQNKPGGTTI